MFTLESEYLKIEINAKGAELNSIYNKKKDIEYMWSGDPAFWGKKSPVLFPIIGSLKNDTYYFENKAYRLSRHGFAREMDFEVTNQNASAITFTLIRNNVTLEKYPFQFKFDIIYSVKDGRLQVTYRVVNKGDINQKLYFSVGGHPAFKLPVFAGTDYTDYWLEFNKKENAGRWPISDEGLIKEEPIPLMTDTNRLPLAKELFYTDAIVFKKLKSTSVKLVSGQYGEIFDFDFTGFPYLGIWAAKGADFVCIEPWCGIADSVNSNQQLTEKEGINVLDSTDQFERSWAFTAY
ncbi:aldose 1-epimerase family protein [Terrimonas pollutisoli]|uniref:aldose 1-epimerase family protein n=1 Tax=Terrimonas pollutisoli TaxID=3034147 RepID=UPI0023EBD340|nr:aldose 1-epimerase family protein [Terrimonas sp. H1YJ31]